MPRECGASGASRLNGSINAVSGILDRPLEPVIGLAEGETRWRATTAACVARSCAMNRFGFNFQTTRVRRHSFAISPRISHELGWEFPHPPIRGRRECRAPDAPAAARGV